MVRLSTVGFTVVSLCLKESLAMPTRGHFVCHVHCLVHDGDVRSSPCGPHHENFGNHLPQPSKSIRYTSYGNTPELPPQYWVASRLSHQELHKRDFRCQRTKLRYSRTATIKLWWQHLRAQLSGTLPLNPWQEAPRQCSRHKTIGTIPRYPCDPKKNLVKFEKRRVKTLRQDALPERWGDWEVKTIPNLSDI